MCSFLIEKDICDCRKVSVKFLGVYVCLSSGDLFIFSVSVSSFFSHFLCYPYFGTFLSTCSLIRYFILLSANRKIELELLKICTNSKYLIIPKIIICGLPWIYSFIECVWNENINRSEMESFYTKIELSILFQILVY